MRRCALCARLTFPGPRGPIAFEDRDIAESEISSTEECEVLIIGAGIGGLMGSLKAAEEGAKVITLEKMTEGRSAWESFGAVGAKFQKEQGIDIDPAQLRDEIYRAADWRVDPCSIETYVNRSGEVADFWQDMLDKGGSGWQLYKFDQAPNYNGFPRHRQLRQLQDARGYQHYVAVRPVRVQGAARGCRNLRQPGDSL